MSEDCQKCGTSMYDLDEDRQCPGCSDQPCHECATLLVAPEPPVEPSRAVSDESVFQVRSHGSCCWEDISGESLELCRSNPEEYEVRTLYRPALTQPSEGALTNEGAGPVEIELPEREMYTQYLRGVIPENRLEVEAYKDGWNACLDRVKELNDHG